MIRARVSLATASIVCLGSAVWFASSWLDDPPDNTCGSLWRTELWLHVRGCTDPMTGRLVVAPTLAALALVGLLLAAIRPPDRALMISAVVVIVAVVVLALNENVRSGGLWAN